MAAVGIDFGTANITVAVWENGSPRIISSVTGASSTPTVIVRHQGEDTFGEDAREQSKSLPQNVVFDFPQFIGLHDYEAVKEAIYDGYYPFNEIDSKRNYLRFNLPNGERLYLVNIVQKFLRQAKELAESALNRNVVMCVVTVPCIWQSHQREFLEQAAKTAGFERVFLVDAAAAALVGCFLHTLNPQTSPRNIVVVDVGASSTTAAVFTATHPNEVSLPMWYSADPAGGGTALDRAIMEHCHNQFRQQPGCANFILNRSQLHRLRVECEDVKKHLSMRRSTEVSVPELVEDFDFHCVINQEQLRNIGAECIRTTLNTIQWALERVAQPTDCHILLVGGASHCGVLRAAIQKQFGDLINPSVLLYSGDAAAFGAAGIAAMVEMVPMSSGQLLLDMFSADRIAQHYHQLTRLFRDWGGEREASTELNRYIIKHSNFSPAASAIKFVTKDTEKVKKDKLSTGVIREHSLTGMGAIGVKELLHGQAWPPQTSQGHYENEYPPLNLSPRSDPDHTQRSQVINWDPDSLERPLYSQRHVAKPVAAAMTVTATVEQHQHSAVPQRVHSMTPTDDEEQFFAIQHRYNHMSSTRVPTSVTRIRTDYDIKRYSNSHETRPTTRQDTSEVRDRPLRSHTRLALPPYEVAAIGSTWRNSEGFRLRRQNPIFRPPQGMFACW
ncbi:putative Heat shock protein sks2 [Hypsibius exemplaris]|uniref:Heat shock protein sks2 n=1 Tax=Hypsibius exemplaris TaxID=2072580 RepID=A0A1W0WZF7_HYPEX|nr:putative Heat shock protein sks2 [Hypsibius exemplaris]